MPQHINRTSYVKGDSRITGKRPESWIKNQALALLRPRKEVLCDFCNAKLQITRSDFRNSKYHFCSKNCYAAWQKSGQKGYQNSFWGKRHSAEALQKQSKAKEGNRNPNWQGGKSLELYGFAFSDAIKRIVLERDNHTCQQCGAVEMLLVYHIDSDKQNSGLGNLITLCRSCHTKLHRKAEETKKED